MAKKSPKNKTKSHLEMDGHVYYVEKVKDKEVGRVAFPDRDVLNLILTVIENHARNIIAKKRNKEPGVSSYCVPQTSTTGINAVIGKWPGDESDEEIAEMLDKSSRNSRNKSIASDMDSPKRKPNGYYPGELP